MKAVILAGGLGTRLRPYTTIIPKPLVPIGDRPVLEHIMHRLSACGINHVDLCVSYLGQLIKAYLGQVSMPAGMSVDFHWESEPLGTAGALQVVPDLDEPFLAMNGDILTTLDYSKLIEFHRERDAALTIAMHSKRVDIDLGVIEPKDGFVTAYREKPTHHYQVSMGVYVYEPRALNYLPSGLCQFPELVLRLLEAGERIGAYPSEAEWYDIGTVEEYERASRDIERSPERWGMSEDPAAAPLGSYVAQTPAAAVVELVEPT